ncbi:hypothetical protein NADE_007555 [Nannochloris sp. 'desiccata']|nr:hypothetical protein NADE_007442 [Chlorella desiccata (nom. nud.)]KAH7615765.1 hypothetical protein NADE_007555 [Chlorella desiccata (nom. nud.)]
MEGPEKKVLCSWVGLSQSQSVPLRYSPLGIPTTKIGGYCFVAQSDRCRVKSEFDPCPVSYPPRKRSRAHSPSSLSDFPPQTKQKLSLAPTPRQVAVAISKKEKTLLKVLDQAQYPSAVAEKLLENTIFKTSGFDERGNIIIKFHMKLPNGSSAGNDTDILLNPYSCGGGGFSGDEYDQHGFVQEQQKKQVQEKETSEEESSLIPTSSGGSASSSSSDEEEEEEKESEGDKEEEESLAKSLPVSLLTTEEEDNVDQQGEDEYSSLES